MTPDQLKHQCPKPSILVMNYTKQYGTRVTNKICTSCGYHWHGSDGDVREYTRAEWDRWINSGSVPA